MNNFLFPPFRLHPVVGGAAGPLGSRVSAHGPGSAGSLHRPAQPAGLGPRQTGPAVRAGGVGQGGVLLHHSARPPGGAAPPPLFCRWKYTFSRFVYPPPRFSGFNPLLAAGDWRPLSVVSASGALEHLVPSPVFFAALPLLGNHLQYPHHL